MLHWLLCALFNLLFLVLIVRVILSWVPSLPEPVEPLARFVRSVTDPLMIPLRRAIPPVRMGPGALDLSPIVLFFGVSILSSLFGCRGLL